MNRKLETEIIVLLAGSLALVDSALATHSKSLPIYAGGGRGGKLLAS